MTNTILKDCIEIIKDLVGDDNLYFDSAIAVKTTPHTHPFSAWGACVSPSNQLYVMDGNQEWHEVDAEEGNAPLVISSLYQRLQLLRIRYAKAS